MRNGAGPVGPATPAAVGCSGGGASSTITCALVPLIPNDDDAPRRGRPLAFQGVRSVSKRIAPLDQSMRGLGCSDHKLFGSSPCCSASTSLITLPVPAAHWVCPMFDLSDPSRSGASLVRCAP